MQEITLYAKFSNIVILVTQLKTKVGEVMSSPAITLSPRKTVKGNASHKSGVSN